LLHRNRDNGEKFVGQTLKNFGLRIANFGCGLNLRSLLETFSITL
jgi:hypothetical protein